MHLVESRPAASLRDRIGAVIAVILLAAWLRGSEHLAVVLRGGLIVHSVLGATLVGLMAISTGRLARQLSVAPLVWLGQRSYGLYLWHWPIIQLAEPRLWAMPDVTRDTLIIIVALVIADSSFRFLEHPIRGHAGWAIGSRATWATTVVITVAIAGAASAPLGNGQAVAFDPGSIARPTAHLDEQTLAPPARPAGVGGSDSFSPVAYFASSPAAYAPLIPAVAEPGAPRRTITHVMWSGDSIAADLSPALDAALSAAGITMSDAALDGARLVNSDPDAVAYIDFVVERLAERRPDVIVVQLSLWDSTADVEQLRTTYGWLAGRARIANATLVIITPPPVRDDLTIGGWRTRSQLQNSWRRALAAEWS